MPAPLDRLALGLARLEPFGLVPKAPGTAGSLAAALLAPWLFLPLALPWRLTLAVAIFFFGAWCASRAEIALGRKDPGSVVIDELLGQWLAYLPLATASPVELGLGFALFRLFDITKPPPIRSAEKWLPGGYGVMLDDVIAGLFAAACLYGYRLI